MHWFLLFIILWGLASCQPTIQPETKAVPETVVTVREAAIRHVVEGFDLGLPMMAEDGWETAVSASPDPTKATIYQFRQDSCAITISYPITSPDATIYRVSFIDTTLDFYWEGDFNTAGQLIDPFSTTIISDNTNIVR